LVTAVDGGEDFLKKNPGKYFPDSWKIFALQEVRATIPDVRPRHSLSFTYVKTPHAPGGVAPSSGCSQLPSHLRVSVRAGNRPSKEAHRDTFWRWFSPVSCKPGLFWNSLKKATQIFANETQKNLPEGQTEPETATDESIPRGWVYQMRPSGRCCRLTPNHYRTPPLLIPGFKYAAAFFSSSCYPSSSNRSPTEQITAPREMQSIAYVPHPRWPASDRPSSCPGHHRRLRPGRPGRRREQERQPGLRCAPTPSSVEIRSPKQAFFSIEPTVVRLTLRSANG
jgi:hypothetical protein